MMARGAYRGLIADLFDRDMRLHWIDFLASFAVFWAGYGLLVFGPILWLKPIGFVVAVFAAYRVASFIHEVVHLTPSKPEQMRFAWGWNLIFGAPFLNPSYLYDSHLDHHKAQTFGTAQDPEYLPMAGKGWGHAILFVVHHALTTPIFAILRIAATPLFELAPNWTEKTLNGKFSSLAINWDYVRAASGRTRRMAKVMAWLSAAWLYFYAGLILIGLLPVMMVAAFLGIVMTSLAVNAIRTLAAHRYVNFDGKILSEEEQLLDSVNLTMNPVIGTLIAPVGLRFHALHHLFPNLPYHNAEKAHRRLMAAIPADDAYRQVNAPSLLAAIGQFCAPMSAQARVLEAAE
ncbi:MAG TPA: fatty acid desaturase [Hyphomonadaceae bacterium]|nr:fatty acid desaturase [Hyphomonadaceae bacterium]